MPSTQPFKLDFKSLNVPEKYSVGDLTGERSREYVLSDGSCYTIQNPVALITREGGTTHRVVDQNGKVHCIPFGKGQPTIVTWVPRDLTKPVAF
jgi:hypothetical protein